MSCDCFIVARNTTRMPRYNRYGGRKDNDCEQTLYLHVSEFNVFSWSSVKLGAKEYPTEIADTILTTLKKDFPHFCNDMYTTCPAVATDPCAEEESECTDGVQVVNPLFEGIWDDDWSIAAGAAKTNEDPARIQSTGIKDHAITVYQDVILPRAGIYKVYYDFEGIDGVDSWTGTISLANAEVLFTASSDLIHKGYVFISVKKNKVGDFYEFPLTTSLILSLSQSSQNFEIELNRLEIDCAIWL